MPHDPAKVTLETKKFRKPIWKKV